MVIVADTISDGRTEEWTEVQARRGREPKGRERSSLILGLASYCKPGAGRAEPQTAWPAGFQSWRSSGEVFESRFPTVLSR